MPSAVLFDFNGVLVDDEELHRSAFNEVLAPLGASMTHESYTNRYLGLDDRGAFETVLADHGRRASPDEIAALIAHKARVYAARAAVELKLFAGSADLVTAVAARVPVVVVSGALRSEIEMGLAKLGVRACVRAIVAAEDVTACKPDPAGYLLALRHLGWSHGVVAIEDSHAGVASARAAGIGVLAVCHSYDAQALREAGAFPVVATIGEVTWEDLLRAVRP